MGFSRGKKSFFDRIICLTVIMTFVITSHTAVPVYAAFAPKSDVRIQNSEKLKNLSSDLRLLASDFSIPTHLGHVEEVYVGSSPQSVVLIQDAHVIADAQRSIWHLVEHFQETYGMDQIGVEGVKSKLDATLFKSFPDKEKLKELFEKFISDSELNGSSAAALFSEFPGDYFGIESWPLYEEGLFLFARAAREEVRLTEKFKSEEDLLNEQKKKTYSKELLEVDRADRRFHTTQGYSSSGEALSKLLKLLASYKRPAEEFPELEAILLELENEKEGALNVDLEVTRIAQEIKPLLAGEALKEFSRDFQKFQTGEMKAEAFALSMRNLTENQKLSVKVSEELRGLMRKQAVLEELQGRTLYKSLERYLKVVKESLFRNDEERTLDGLSRNLRLKQKFAKLEIGFDEWKELSGAFGDDSSVKDFQPHIDFYENALARDKAMFERVREKIEKKGNQKQSVVIAGGFHTAGLTEQFEESGISYVLITPKMESFPDESLYKRQMKGEVSWKSYFKAENEKINMHDAFVRYSRDVLLDRRQVSETRSQKNLTSELSPLTSDNRRLAKLWRDEIIRDLSRNGKITEAGNYTKFLDEIGDEAELHQMKSEWLSNVDDFIRKLEGLESSGKLTEQNVLNLIAPATIPSQFLTVFDATVQMDERLMRFLNGERDSRIESYAKVIRSEAKQAAEELGVIRSEAKEVSRFSAQPGERTQRVSVEEAAGYYNMMQAVRDSADSAKAQLDKMTPNQRQYLLVQMALAKSGELTREEFEAFRGSKIWVSNVSEWPGMQNMLEQNGIPDHPAGFIQVTREALQFMRKNGALSQTGRGVMNDPGKWGPRTTFGNERNFFRDVGSYVFVEGFNEGPAHESFHHRAGQKADAPFVVRAQSEFEMLEELGAYRGENLSKLQPGTELEQSYTPGQIATIQTYAPQGNLQKRSELRAATGVVMRMDALMPNRYVTHFLNRARSLDEINRLGNLSDQDLIDEIMPGFSVQELRRAKRAGLNPDLKMLLDFDDQIRNRDYMRELREPIREKIQEWANGFILGIVQTVKASNLSEQVQAKALLRWVEDGQVDPVLAEALKNAFAVFALSPKDLEDQANAPPQTEPFDLENFLRNEFFVSATPPTPTRSEARGASNFLRPVFGETIGSYISRLLGTNEINYVDLGSGVERFEEGGERIVQPDLTYGSSFIERLGSEIQVKTQYAIDVSGVVKRERGNEEVFLRDLKGPVANQIMNFEVLYPDLWQNLGHNVDVITIMTPYAQDLAKQLKEVQQLIPNDKPSLVFIQYHSRDAISIADREHYFMPFENVALLSIKSGESRPSNFPSTRTSQDGPIDILYSNPKSLRDTQIIEVRSESRQEMRELSEEQSEELLREIYRELKPSPSSTEDTNPWELKRGPPYELFGKEISFEIQPEFELTPTHHAIDLVRVGSLVYVRIPRNVEGGIKNKVEGLKSRLGELYTQYAGNILFVATPDYINEFDAKGDFIRKSYPMHFGTMDTIAAMLAQRDHYQDEEVVVFGSGNGILGLTALKLGAKKVHLFEMDSASNREAQAILASQGYARENASSEGDYTLTEINFQKDYYQFQSMPLVTRLREEAKAAVIHIGGPFLESLSDSLYGTSNSFVINEITRNWPGLHSVLNTSFGPDRTNEDSLEKTNTSHSSQSQVQNEEILAVSSMLQLNGFQAARDDDGLVYSTRDHSGRLIFGVRNQLRDAEDVSVTAESVERYQDLDWNQSHDLTIQVLRKLIEKQGVQGKFPTLIQGPSYDLFGKKISFEMEPFFAQNPKRRIRNVMRVGPLTFIRVPGTNAKSVELYVEELKQSLGEVYEKNRHNIIFTVEPDYANELDASGNFVRNYVPMHFGTADTVAVLLSQPESVRDKEIAIFGSGAGVLALATLKLGAKKVHLFEKDSKSNRLAKAILEAQGYQEDSSKTPGNFRITQIDFEKESYKFESLSAVQQARESVETVVVHIGGPFLDRVSGESIYGTSNINALYEMVRNWEGVTTVLNTYYGPDLSGRSVEEVSEYRLRQSSAQNEELKAVNQMLRLNGFKGVQADDQLVNLTPDGEARFVLAVRPSGESARDERDSQIAYFDFQLHTLQRTYNSVWEGLEKFYDGYDTSEFNNILEIFSKLKRDRKSFLLIWEQVKNQKESQGKEDLVDMMVRDIRTVSIFIAVTRILAFLLQSYRGFIGMGLEVLNWSVNLIERIGVRIKDRDLRKLFNQSPNHLGMILFENGQYILLEKEASKTEAKASEVNQINLSIASQRADELMVYFGSSVGPIPDQPDSFIPLRQSVEAVLRTIDSKEKVDTITNFKVISPRREIERDVATYVHEIFEASNFRSENRQLRDGFGTFELPKLELDRQSYHDPFSGEDREEIAGLIKEYSTTPHYYDVETSTGRRIFIADHHHRALFFWLEAYRDGLISENSMLFHIDGHADDEISDRAFKALPDLNQIDEATRKTIEQQYGIATFIAPATVIGLVDPKRWYFQADLENIVYREQFKWKPGTLGKTTVSPFGLSHFFEGRPLAEVVPEGDIDIVDFDIDVFAPQYGMLVRQFIDQGFAEDVAKIQAEKELLDVWVPKMVPIVSRAKVLSIVTSPGYIEQNLALNITNQLLELLNGYSGAVDDLHELPEFPIENDWNNKIIEAKEKYQPLLATVESISLEDAKRQAATLLEATDQPELSPTFEKVVETLEKSQPNTLMLWRLASLYHSNNNQNALRLLLGLFKASELEPIDLASLAEFLLLNSEDELMPNLSEGMSEGRKIGFSSLPEVTVDDERVTVSITVDKSSSVDDYDFYIRWGKYEWPEDRFNDDRVAVDSIQVNSDRSFSLNHTFQVRDEGYFYATVYAQHKVTGEKIWQGVGNIHANTNFSLEPQSDINTDGQPAIRSEAKGETLFELELTPAQVYRILTKEGLPNQDPRQILTQVVDFDFGLDHFQNKIFGNVDELLRKNGFNYQRQTSIINMGSLLKHLVPEAIQNSIDAYLQLYGIEKPEELNNLSEDSVLNLVITQQIRKHEGQDELVISIKDNAVGSEVSESTEEKRAIKSAGGFRYGGRGRGLRPESLRGFELYGVGRTIFIDLRDLRRDRGEGGQGAILDIRFVLQSAEAALNAKRSEARSLALDGITEDEKLASLKSEWSDWLPPSVEVDFKRDTAGNIVASDDKLHVLFFKQTPDGASQTTPSGELILGRHSVDTSQINRFEFNGENPFSSIFETDFLADAHLYRNIFNFLSQREFLDINVPVDRARAMRVLTQFENEKRVRSENTGIQNQRVHFYLPDLDLAQESIYTQFVEQMTDWNQTRYHRNNGHFSLQRTKPHDIYSNIDESDPNYTGFAASMTDGVGSVREWEGLKQVMKTLLAGDSLLTQPGIDWSKEAIESEVEIDALMNILSDGHLGILKPDEMNAIREAYNHVTGAAFALSPASFGAPKMDVQNRQMQVKFNESAAITFEVFTRVLQALYQKRFPVRGSPEVIDFDRDNPFVFVETPIIFTMKNGVELNQQALTLHPEAGQEIETYLRENPHRTFQIFEVLANSKNIRLSPELRSALYQNRNNFKHWVDEERLKTEPSDAFQFLNDSWQRLWGILPDQENSFSTTLWEMHRLELIDGYLSEFGAVRNMIAAPRVHNFTVDQHTLYTIQVLDEIYSSNDPTFAKAREILRTYYQDDPDRIRMLRFTMLFHDLGKSDFYPGAADHAQVMAEVLLKPDSRLAEWGVEHKKIERSAWLVRNHMMANEFARERLVEHPAEIAYAVENLVMDIENSPRGIDMLYLVSLADRFAVKPETLMQKRVRQEPVEGSGPVHSWSEVQQLHRLYNESAKIIKLVDDRERQDALDELDEQIKRQIEADQLRFRNEQFDILRVDGDELEHQLDQYMDTLIFEDYLAMRDEIKREFIENYAQIFATYLETYSIHELILLGMMKSGLRQHISRLLFITHLRVLRQKQMNTPVVFIDSRVRDDFEYKYEVQVGVPFDKPGTFARITGVLWANDVDVAGAESLSTSEGIVLDRFRGSVASEQDLAELAKALKRDMRSVFDQGDGGKTVAQIFEDKNKDYLIRQLEQGIPERIEANFDLDTEIRNNEVSTLRLSNLNKKGILHLQALLIHNAGFNIVRGPAASRTYVVDNTFYINHRKKSLKPAEKGRVIRRAFDWFSRDVINLASLWPRKADVEIEGKAIEFDRSAEVVETGHSALIKLGFSSKDPDPLHRFDFYVRWGRYDGVDPVWPQDRITREEIVDEGNGHFTIYAQADPNQSGAFGASIFAVDRTMPPGPAASTWFGVNVPDSDIKFSVSEKRSWETDDPKVAKVNKLALAGEILNVHYGQYAQRLAALNQFWKQISDIFSDAHILAPTVTPARYAREINIAYELFANFTSKRSRGAVQVSGFNTHHIELSEMIVVGEPGDQTKTRLVQVLENLGVMIENEHSRTIKNVETGIEATVYFLELRDKKTGSRVSENNLSIFREKIRQAFRGEEKEDFDVAKNFPVNLKVKGASPDMLKISDGLIRKWSPVVKEDDPSFVRPEDSETLIDALALNEIALFDQTIDSLTSELKGDADNSMRASRVARIKDYIYEHNLLYEKRMTAQAAVEFAFNALKNEQINLLSAHVSDEYSQYFRVLNTDYEAENLGKKSEKELLDLRNDLKGEIEKLLTRPEDLSQERVQDLENIRNLMVLRERTYMRNRDIQLDTFQILQSRLMVPFSNREKLLYLEAGLGNLTLDEIKSALIDREKKSVMTKLAEIFLNLPYGLNTDRSTIQADERELAQTRIATITGQLIPSVMMQIENGKSAKTAIDETLKLVLSQITQTEQKLEEAKANHRREGTAETLNKLEVARHFVSLWEEFESFLSPLRSALGTYDYSYDKAERENRGVRVTAIDRERVRFSVVKKRVTEKYFSSVDILNQEFLDEFDQHVLLNISQGKSLEAAISDYYHFRHRGFQTRLAEGDRREILKANTGFEFMDLEAFDYLMKFYDTAQFDDPTRQAGEDLEAGKEVIVLASNIENEVHYNQLMSYNRRYKVVGIIAPKTDAPEFRLPHWFTFAKKAGIPTVPFVDLAAADLSFDDIPDKLTAAVDGKTGEVIFNPSEDMLTGLRAKTVVYAHLGRFHDVRADLPSTTDITTKAGQQKAVQHEILVDETRLSAFKDIAGKVSEVLSSGGVGVGLLRLEEIILGELERRGIELDENRLALALTEILTFRYFGDGRPLIVRLFDLAEDKRPAFVTEGVERGDWSLEEILKDFTGSRFYLSKDPKYRAFRDFGKKQLRALFKAHLHEGVQNSSLRILFSDVRNAEEIFSIEELIAEATREFLDEIQVAKQAAEKGDNEKKKVYQELTSKLRLSESQLERALNQIPVGYMFEETLAVRDQRQKMFEAIEAVRSRRPAERFIGIGSNDLTKSIVRDRMGGDGSATAFSPHLVRDVWRVAQSARERGLHVTLEGEWGNSIAAHFMLLAFQILDELEVTPVAATNRVPEILEFMRQVTQEDLELPLEGGESFLNLIEKIVNSDEGDELISQAELNALVLSLVSKIDQRITSSPTFHAHIWETSFQRELTHPRIKEEYQVSDLAKEIVEKELLPKGSHIVTFGSFLGYDELYLAENGYRITATDFIQGPLDHLQKEAGGKGLDQLISTQQVDLNQAIQIEGGPFAAAFTHMSLFYLQNDDVFKARINEIADLLVDGGLIAFAGRSLNDPKYQLSLNKEDDYIVRASMRQRYFSVDSARQLFEPRFEIDELVEAEPFERYVGEGDSHLIYLFGKKRSEARSEFYERADYFDLRLATESQLSPPLQPYPRLAKVGVAYADLFIRLAEEGVAVEDETGGAELSFNVKDQSLNLQSSIIPGLMQETSILSYDTLVATGPNEMEVLPYFWAPQYPVTLQVMRENASNFITSFSALFIGGIKPNQQLKLEILKTVNRADETGAVKETLVPVTLPELPIRIVQEDRVTGERRDSHANELILPANFKPDSAEEFINEADLKRIVLRASFVSDDEFLQNRLTFKRSEAREEEDEGIDPLEEMLRLLSPERDQIQVETLSAKEHLERLNRRARGWRRSFLTSGISIVGLLTLLAFIEFGPIPGRFREPIELVLSLEDIGEQGGVESGVAIEATQAESSSESKSLDDLTEKEFEELKQIYEELFTPKDDSISETVESAELALSAASGKSVAETTGSAVGNEAAAEGVGREPVSISEAAKGALANAKPGRFYYSPGWSTVWSTRDWLSLEARDINVALIKKESIRKLGLKRTTKLENAGIKTIGDLVDNYSGLRLAMEVGLNSPEIWAVDTALEEFNQRYGLELALQVDDPVMMTIGNKDSYLVSQLFKEGIQTYLNLIDHSAAELKEAVLTVKLDDDRLELIEKVLNDFHLQLRAPLAAGMRSESRAQDISVTHPDLESLIGMKSFIGSSMLYGVPTPLNGFSQGDFAQSLRFAKIAKEFLLDSAIEKSEVNIAILGAGAGLDSMTALNTLLSRQEIERVELDAIDVEEEAVRLTKNNLYGQLRALGRTSSMSGFYGRDQMSFRGGRVQVPLAKIGNEFESVSKDRTYDFVLMNVPNVATGDDIDNQYEIPAEAFLTLVEGLSSHLDENSKGLFEINTNFVGLSTEFSDLLEAKGLELTFIQEAQGLLRGFYVLNKKRSESREEVSSGEKFLQMNELPATFDLSKPLDYTTENAQKLVEDLLAVVDPQEGNEGIFLFDSDDEGFKYITSLRYRPEGTVSHKNLTGLYLGQGVILKGIVNKTNDGYYLVMTMHDTPLDNRDELDAFGIYYPQLHRIAKLLIAGGLSPDQKVLGTNNAVRLGKSIEDLPTLAELAALDRETVIRSESRAASSVVTDQVYDLAMLLNPDDRARSEVQSDARRSAAKWIVSGVISIEDLRRVLKTAVEQAVEDLIQLYRERTQARNDAPYLKAIEQVTKMREIRLLSFLTNLAKTQDGKITLSITIPDDRHLPDGLDGAAMQEASEDYAEVLTKILGNFFKANLERFIISGDAGRVLPQALREHSFLFTTERNLKRVSLSSNTQKVLPNLVAAGDAALEDFVLSIGFIHDTTVSPHARRDARVTQVAYGIASALAGQSTDPAKVKEELMKALLLLDAGSYAGVDLENLISLDEKGLPSINSAIMQQILDIEARQMIATSA